MLQAECKINGCRIDVRKRGFCNKHYSQARRSGKMVNLPKVSPEQLFLEKINKPSDSECWEWAGHLMVNGYGQLTAGARQWTAHRFSYTMHKGKIPDGLIIRHSCHNRKCVNPDHLSTGTMQDNSDDMVKAGRQCLGEKQGLSKLVEANIVDIYKMGKEGKYQSYIAREFNIDQSGVSRILSGEYWAHMYENNKK